MTEPTTGCEPYRQALSAQVDGEDLDLPASALGAHVDACESCRAWSSELVVLTRSARVHAAEPVPDLTGPILRAIASADARPGSSVVRLGLALVACAQLLVVVPALLGNDLGASVHVAHEQGAWGVALAAGLGFAAWRPDRAVGMLPFLVAFVGCMAALALPDIIAGNVAPTTELPHGMAAIGLLLLWLEAHPVAGAARAVPELRAA